MTFYPARDWQVITSVPGCDQLHERPRDAHGRPVHPWVVECPAHEAFYKGAHKPKILKFVTDKKTGQVLRQERIADMHPGVGFTLDTIPMTRDEEETRGLQLEKGENQLRALESIATLTKAGIDFRSRPEVLLFLRENNLPEEMLQGSVLCLDNHANAAGAKFCAECGASMSARAAIGGTEDEVQPRPRRKSRSSATA